MAVENKYCWEYEMYVHHRQPQGKNKLYKHAPVLPNIEDKRRTKKDFNNTFCSNCLNSNCEQWKDSNNKSKDVINDAVSHYHSFLDPVASVKRDSYKTNTDYINEDIVNEDKFIDLPDTFSAMTICGEINIKNLHPYWSKFDNDDIILYCQALIVSITEDIQMIQIFIDGRKNPDYININFKECQDIIVNICGEQKKIGSFTPSFIVCNDNDKIGITTDTFIVNGNLNEMEEIVKNIFFNIANNHSEVY